MIPKRLTAALCATLLFCSAAAARDIPVDLELVLAVDVSGSVDEVEAGLQRDGYVKALRHPDVLNAINTGFLRKIAVTYVEWAGTETQSTVVGWRLVEDEGSAYALSKEIDGAPFTRGRFTSISAAIRYAVPLFENNGFEGTRRVIDVSGDGANNVGGLVTEARDMAVARGITINGLPIVNDRMNQFGPQMKDLDLYYRNCVIGGTGAFLVVAKDFQSFARAVRRKLVLEIAGLMPPPRPLFHRAAGPPPPPCDAGEQNLRRRLMNQF
jgi:hypothetical protein